MCEVRNVEMYWEKHKEEGEEASGYRSLNWKTSRICSSLLSLASHVVKYLAVVRIFLSTPGAESLDWSTPSVGVLRSFYLKYSDCPNHLCICQCSTTGEVKTLPDTRTDLINCNTAILTAFAMVIIIMKCHFVCFRL